MKALIATWPRRVAVAVSAWLIATVLMASLMAHIEQPDPAHLEIGDWMKRFLVVPGLTALAVFLFTTAIMRPAFAATVQEPAGKAASVFEEPPERFVAQVVGLMWLNPLQRMDYSTEWQLLWTQGLAVPNKNDDMVRTDSKSFTTLQSVAGIAYGNEGEETFNGFYHKYVRKFLVLMRSRYFANARYFYTVKSENSKDWRELAGMQIEFALPPRLDPIEAKTYLTNEFVECFEIGPPSPKTLWSRDTPPNVQITQGGANAGFTSLNKALDYLQANPDKTVWAINWDAPNFPPTDAQINENLVVLFLAGPNFNTQREPLAWIGKAAIGNTHAFSPKVGTTRAVQAWKATIDQAARNAGVAVPDLKYIVHDAGAGSDTASSRVAALAQTLTETLPEYDHQKQTFNTAALLGDMGTGSALTDVALAIGRINHFGGNALVAGTTDPDHPVAVVVMPPSKLTPIDPDKDWFRARGGNNAYLPWWGRRHDTNYGMQGYSW
ncbi:virulence factor [Burkholderia contaminans]|uniref:virulence factor n=1 Tax=Burkholderia contaminans TaxID=488447 RepID=UPI001F2C2361|nr:virulence factor [Burkholderia contaminans]MEB4633035.1 virulence factor [Burkholderia contaminans]MEB4640643.1 virulence factor [Burkholderia contaminans]MEB4655635.1 virulence factor [Burkholderia contaminans]MEB4663937.1 virulence factor [Burkholderia contaminans]MEB4670541.1 virulence factor [Burkholderia contaminans]